MKNYESRFLNVQFLIPNSSFIIRIHVSLCP